MSATGEGPEASSRVAGDDFSDDALEVLRLGGAQGVIELEDQLASRIPADGSIPGISLEP